MHSRHRATVLVQIFARAEWGRCVGGVRCGCGWVGGIRVGQNLMI